MGKFPRWSGVLGGEARGGGEIELLELRIDESTPWPIVAHFCS